MSHGYLKLSMFQTKHICFLPSPLKLLLLLYPYIWECHPPPPSYPRQLYLLFYPPMNRQVLLILPPIYLLCLPLFLQLHCHYLPQVSIISHLDDLIGNLSGLLGYSASQLKYLLWTAARVIFPKHKAALSFICLTSFPHLLR